MKNKSLTIRKIVSYLNNPDEEGGFWLPNIQRPFVWKEEQICRLFDSILREYPISTLLVWKTDSSIKRRKFIDNWKGEFSGMLSNYYVPEDNKKKCLILDGQQRLQALFISLCGSYEGKELYFNILSGGENAAPDDIKYKFEFLEQRRAIFPWIKMKDLVFTNKKKKEIIDEIKNLTKEELTESDIDRIEENIDMIERSFKTNEEITYQELDQIDNPSLYTDDDVVEIFIRANSGGTKLEKSDLLFSLLSASWDKADENMEQLLDKLNSHGFAFTRDFILKSCLLLLGKGARYEVTKFRKEGVRQEIESKWANISSSIADVLDFVRGKTYIQCDKALPSYLVLMPLIYLRYNYPLAWKSAKGIENYILRCSLGGAFSGQSDRLLDALKKKIDEMLEPNEDGAEKFFKVEDMFTVIKSQGRSLELTQEQLLRMGYGSKTVHLLFNIWYRDFAFTPSYENNMPQVDHVFPQSLLKNKEQCDKDEINQLANCMLLTRDENGAGGKWDTPPAQWFANKDEYYLRKHKIPLNKSLWEIDKYEEFIRERKKLILRDFDHLLLKE